MLDIGGYDAAHKLTLLSTIAFGGNVDFNLNQVEGIEKITIEDIKEYKLYSCGITLLFIFLEYVIFNVIIQIIKSIKRRVGI